MIDVHAHIGRLVTDRKRFLDVTDLILKMDAWGIERACVHGLSEHPEAHYMDSDTEDVLAACSPYPERLIPFCLIDPRFGMNDVTMDFSYLLEEYKARGCKGMGEMLPKMQVDDPRCINLFQQTGKYGLPITFDMNDNPIHYGLRDDYGLPRLERTLQECPETVFVGHGPTFWAEISVDIPEGQRFGYPTGAVKSGGAVPRLMAKYDNLWADLSAGSGHNAITRDEKFGLEFLGEFQDKLMFGTDSCARLNHVPDSLNVALMRRLQEQNLISEDAWNKIAHGNATRLYGL